MKGGNGALPVHLMVVVVGIPLYTKGYWLHKLLVYRVTVTGEEDEGGYILCLFSMFVPRILFHLQYIYTD